MTNPNEKQQEKKRTTRQAALPVLVGHVLETLPDSLARREEVLGALAAFIPAGSGSGAPVRMLQVHLRAHQQIRLDWAGAGGPG